MCNIQYSCNLKHLKHSMFQEYNISQIEQNYQWKDVM